MKPWWLIAAVCAASGLSLHAYPSPGAPQTPPTNLTAPAANLWPDAARGSAEAAYQLGAAYLNGTQGAPQDEAEAKRWLGEAAKANQPLALHLLAQAHEKGLLGFPANEETAEDWYERAMKANNLESELWEAHYWLARGLSRGVEASVASGLSMYLHAAAKGDGPSEAKVAAYYATGFHCLAKNPRMAYLWSLMATTRGLPDSDTQASNARLQRDLEANLTPADVAFLQARRDLFLANLTKYGVNPFVDDAPEEAVSIPPEGATGPTPPNSTLIKVMVDIDGKGSHLFLIDTGCCNSWIAPGAAKALGLSVGGQASTEYNHPDPVYLLSGHIFGAEIRNIRIAPSNNIPGFKNKEIEGILGWNFVRLLRVKYDYRKKLATLLPAATTSRTGEIPLAFAFGIPEADVVVEGVNHDRFTVKAELDTGNSGDVIMGEEINVAHPFKGLVASSVGQTYQGVEGKHSVKCGHAAALEIGSSRISQPALVYEPGLTGANWAQLNVGMQQLRKFVFEIDYANARIYLQPTDALTEEATKGDGTPRQDL